MRTYRILPGHSFRADDGSILEAPATLELADDAALLHVGKIAPVAVPDTDTDTAAPAAAQA